ncbi:MAG: PAS domain-containing protein, partial [Syntrophorhabdaceae bacterium]|nr:PAS domain-containing protein [Syntrophorhabdaceae bacterium]
MSSETNISKNTLRSILNSIPIGIYVIDRELKIRWVNQRMLLWMKERRTSHERDKSCYSAIFGNKAPCDDCPAFIAFKSGRAEYAEIKKTGKSG